MPSFFCQIHYERYDRKFGADGTHDPLNWAECSEAVERFKEDVIFADMVETEAESKSMMDWLKFLRMHTFTPRHFENEVSGWNSRFTGIDAMLGGLYLPPRNYCDRK